MSDKEIAKEIVIALINNTNPSGTLEDVAESVCEVYKKGLQVVKEES